MIKVCLIWPYGFDPRSTLPLSLAYLKSNLDQSKYEVKIYDCVLHNVNKKNSSKLKKFIDDFSPDIVGITAWASVYDNVKNILRIIKSVDNSIVTIVGGYHATAYAEKIITEPEVDFVFLGEGEKEFSCFLDELQKEHPLFSSITGLCYKTDKGIVKNNVSLIENLDEINWPDFDAINIEEYFNRGYRNMSLSKRNIPIIATRGCYYRCEFCSAPLVSGRIVRKHTSDYLIKQIQYLYKAKKIRWFNFIDDNFFSNISFAKEVCKKIIEADFKKIGFGTPSGVRMKKNNHELWKLMKKAGWDMIIIAPESGSNNTLKLMKKDPDLSIVPEVIEDIRHAKLNVIGFFMVGYPGETKDDLNKTLSFIKKNDFDLVSIHNFQPIPGTPIYNRLVNNGDIQEGIMPKKYGYGERVFTPKELLSINFQLLSIKMYLYFMKKKPIFFIKYLFRMRFARIVVSSKINILSMMGNLRNSIGSFANRN